jgi:hypothetical protein
MMPNASPGQVRQPSAFCSVRFESAYVKKTAASRFQRGGQHRANRQPPKAHRIDNQDWQPAEGKGEKTSASAYRSRTTDVSDRRRSWVCRGPGAAGNCPLVAVHRGKEDGRRFAAGRGMNKEAARASTRAAFREVSNTGSIYCAESIVKKQGHTAHKAG